MMRTVSTMPARVVEIEGEHVPGTTRRVTLEQEGENFGSFKVRLPSEDCCNMVQGAQAIIEVKQKVQDGQHART